MKVAFYYVNEDYINYLKQKEIKERGFTTVPNVKYNSKNKFFYGVVLKVNNMPYYVPITHYTKDKQHNLIIKIEHNHKQEAVGSMRFNYMIPVPKKCLTPLNFKDSSMYNEVEKNKLQKEYKFCLRKLSAVQKLADKTYKQVMVGKSEELVRHSCAFRILEEAYKEYIKETSE